LEKIWKNWSKKGVINIMENASMNNINNEIKIERIDCKQRKITVYMLYCEGRRYDEIAHTFNVSKSTVYNDIKWCQDNISNGFPNESFEDILFDTVRRRAILWSRFKKLSKINFSTIHLVNVSKHILDLDKKILEWKEIIKNSEKTKQKFDPDNIDHILNLLDKFLKSKSEQEIEELKKRILPKHDL
jgi:predicted DNA-binding protein YlxM (UPF0122 family)